MLFNIEHDLGREIIGYLVPDGFTGRATIRVTRRGDELLTKQTDSLRESLVHAGRHETGLCGFTIDDGEIPGLAEITDLEIRDAESDVIIYRRYNPEAIVRQKIFRLETHLLPLSRIDRAVQPRFQFYFPSIDRFGLETTHQMFLMNNTDSVYASGRVSYRSVEYYLDQGYTSVAMVQEPFEELAERVLLLRLIGENRAGILGLRDSVTFETVKSFASGLPLDSDRALSRAFRDMDPEVANMLTDPVTRQLTTRLPDEVLKPSSIGQALSVLSGFRIVGVRHRAELFADALVDALSLHTGEVPVVEPIPAARELGARLREMPSVERLLEHDIAVFHFLSEAFEKSLIES
ncbi:hypothetical protein [Enterovirga aerilata]|uniref:Uncharacterized protein n=1 Tax=Enterovirga aerilata TaxID=2730920 RepID=A0A849IB80_9HYPH|nr:hypothetical protein [Enterovirga sp. DB1703]NNM74541.1 hypothetical protein [Enterovirga sp. DB1703]